MLIFFTGYPGLILTTSYPVRDQARLGYYPVGTSLLQGFLSPGFGLIGLGGTAQAAAKP